MRAINCTIKTIAKATSANGLQDIVRTLVVAGLNSVSTVRGLFMSVGREYALAMRYLGLRLSALRPASQAMLKCRHRQTWQAGRLDDMGGDAWSPTVLATGSPGLISIG